MNNKINIRIKLLRELMLKNGLSAYLVNGSDPHMSEYVPDRWKTRDYLSGFTGSFGFMAITQKQALLWTDSRYYLQAGQQLEGTGIEMMKAREPESISLDQWLYENLESGNVVGFDGTCYSASEIIQLKHTLDKKGIKTKDDIDLIDAIWENRPLLPNAKAFLHPINHAGIARTEKILQLRDTMHKSEANCTIISALDDLAWTFNIRGADVECNPVVMGYGIISNHKAMLFTHSEKFTHEALSELKADGVEVLDYKDFYTELQKINNQRILIDPNRANYSIYQKLAQNNFLNEQLSASALLKSVKNSSEIEGMKKAHISDGLALLDFQLWLEQNIGKQKITEYDVALKLKECRAKKFGFVGESFFPIVGYRNHGAIVHFKVTPETANELLPEGILLFDSGGQYEYGTTDITRTIALGPVSEQMKNDFTLVLKGMVALSTINFVKGTCGCHLDVLARAALWNANLNYGHGTGHGVGAFMNVHEGPQSIRPDLNNQALRPGNILSNEPGLYRTNEYGIRIENLIHCIEAENNQFGTFYRFETLTRYPIDTRLINKSLLNSTEINWINNYHKTVLTALSPFTSSEEFKLLKRLTEAI